MALGAVVALLVALGLLSDALLVVEVDVVDAVGLEVDVVFDLDEEDEVLEGWSGFSSVFRFCGNTLTAGLIVVVFFEDTAEVVGAGAGVTAGCSVICMTLDFTSF